MIRDNLGIVIALAAGVLAIIQTIRPVLPHVSPAILAIIALLGGVRYAVRRQARRRDRMLRDVPKRPLGLD
jgi:Flp pilus assembly protein TadB